MEALVHALESTGEYRVLRRFDPTQLALHAAGDSEKPFRGLVIDVETTGVNPHTDQLIEIALLPFTATKAGRLVSVREPAKFLRDLGIPIPAEITSLTGISDGMVAGQVLDVPGVGAYHRGRVVMLGVHGNSDLAGHDSTQSCTGKAADRIANGIARCGWIRTTELRHLVQFGNIRGNAINTPRCRSPIRSADARII